MSDTERRLYGADFIRACACFVVLFHHLAQRIDFQSELGGHQVAQVFASIGGFGVGMFFVLSGFLLARPFWLKMDLGQPLPSLRNYALRRAARIVPGFWLVLTVSFLLSVTVYGFDLDGWMWLRYGVGLLLLSDWHWTTMYPVEVNGPLWSIGFEVTSYILLPLAFFAVAACAGGRMRGWPARLVWLGVIATALLTHWLWINTVAVDPDRRGWEFGLQGGARLWMPWFNPFSFFAMFAVGALAAGAEVLLARVRSIVVDAAASVAVVLAVLMLWTSDLSSGVEYYGWLRVPYGFPLFHLLIGTALATLPSSLVLGRIVDNPVIRYLARISFGIYIWHYIVMELVQVYWAPEFVQWSVRDPALFLVTSGVIIAVTMAIATLSYRWLEVPIMVWARQFEKERTDAREIAEAA